MPTLASEMPIAHFILKKTKHLLHCEHTISQTAAPELPQNGWQRCLNHSVLETLEMAEMIA